jgi:hypothetical protein
LQTALNCLVAVHVKAAPTSEVAYIALILAACIINGGSE